MKVIIILSVILVSVLGEELTFDNNSNENLLQRGRISQFQLRNQNLNQNPRYHHRLSGDQDYEQVSEDSNTLTPSVLESLWRARQNTNTPNSNTATDSSLGYWANYPDAAAFDAKIKARLDSSRVLVNKPEIRNKLTQLAEEKFNTCKGLVEDRERACLGRVTGQVMQLVAAVENMNRNSHV